MEADVWRPAGHQQDPRTALTCPDVTSCRPDRKSSSDSGVARTGDATREQRRVKQHRQFTHVNFCSFTQLFPWRSVAKAKPPLLWIASACRFRFKSKKWRGRDEELFRSGIDQILSSRRHRHVAGNTVSSVTYPVAASNFDAICRNEFLRPCAARTPAGLCRREPKITSSVPATVPTVPTPGVGCLLETGAGHQRTGCWLLGSSN